MDPTGGAYSAPQTLAGLTGVRGKGEWKEEEEGGEMNCVGPLHLYFLHRPLHSKYHMSAAIRGIILRGLPNFLLIF